MVSVHRFALRRPLFVGASIYVLVLVLAATTAPVITNFDPTEINPRSFLQPPDALHWFGTDELGRDVFARILYGARTSLAISFGAVAVALLLGVLVGLTSAVVGGWRENVVMRVIDVMLTLPALLLAIATASFLGNTLPHLIGVLGFVYLPRFARVAHGAAMQVRETEYVQAAIALGSTRRRLLVRTVLPNSLAPIIVQATLALAFVITTESALSFLGLGPPPPSPTWGRLINQSRTYMDMAPHLLAFPSMVLGLTILSFNLIGDELQDLTSPRRKG